MSAQPVPPPLVVRDNAQWLRYVFFAGATGLSMHLAYLLLAAQVDAGKVAGLAAGAALFAFCGWILEVRRLVIDPTSRQIRVESRRGGRRTVENLEFAKIIRILVVRTFDHDGEALPANRRRERWSVVLLAGDGRQVPIGINPEVSRAAAMALAQKVRDLIAVEVSDDPAEAEAYLAGAGGTVDAVTALRQAKGLALGKALDEVRRAGEARRP